MTGRFECAFCKTSGRYKQVAIPDRGGACGTARTCPKCRKGAKLELYDPKDWGNY